MTREEQIEAGARALAMLLWGEPLAYGENTPGWSRFLDEHRPLAAAVVDAISTGGERALALELACLPEPG